MRDEISRSFVSKDQLDSQQDDNSNIAQDKFTEQHRRPLADLNTNHFGIGSEFEIQPV